MYSFTNEGTISILDPRHGFCNQKLYRTQTNEHSTVRLCVCGENMTEVFSLHNAASVIRDGHRRGFPLTVNVLFRRTSGFSVSCPT